MKQVFNQAVLMLALLGVVVVGCSVAAASFTDLDVAKSPERIQSEIRISEEKAAADRRAAEQWTRIAQVLVVAGASVGLVILSGYAVVVAMNFHENQKTARAQLVPTRYGYALPLSQAHYAGAASVARARSARRPPHSLHYAPHYALPAVPRGIEAQALVGPDHVGAISPLPTAPVFTDLLASGFQPSMERLILGYVSGGPLWGSIDDLLSTLIVGRPGTGKTTLQRFLLAQLIAAGAEVAALDPHGNLAEMLPAGVMRWRAETGEEIDQAARELAAEMDSRLALRRDGQRDFVPLLILVDEWNILAEISESAVYVVRRVILEARKVRGYAVISGQGAPASSFGGSVARDGLSSRYVLWTTPSQARMAGLEARAARELLAQLGTDPLGHAILARSSAEPCIVAIPKCEPSDLVRVVGG
jgi:hypothetical protein